MPYNADGDCVRNVKSGFKTCICMVNVLSCLQLSAKGVTDMSLTKADSYKNNREKRKREEKKKKLLFRLKTALAAVIIVLIVVWIDFPDIRRLKRADREQV